MYGFLLSGGFTTIKYPESVVTVACGINDHGEIVGRWEDAARKIRGFRLSQGHFTSFEFPGAQATMIDSGRISNRGDIVGPYTDARGRTKAFLLSAGRYTSFDVPGSTNTQGRKINASGQITGIYYVSGRYYGFVTTLAPQASQSILVDDDGADCPGALTTIQEAVRRAAPGASILVCRGIYTGTVSISGAEKDGLKLIALGRAGEVILQGDYLARDGFHLQNVSNVLIRGFLVRDFGEKATTASEWGAGNLIHLENAHYITIEHNQFANPDRAAVLLVDSANNVIQHNVAWADNANLASCGVEVRGAKSANNVISLNMTYGNKLAGVMLAGAGAGNVVRDNSIVANGRYGIDIQNTLEAWVEGNRVSYSRGFWGTTPGGQQPGLGINLANLVKATVFDNRARGNTGADLNWDGKGDNRIEANACDTCVPASACGK
jgi:parallel beta-helix repeat protein